MLTFFEAICEGERLGLSRAEAASRLLAALRTPAARGRVLGVCHISHSTDKEDGGYWRAVRDDTTATPVPQSIWDCFDQVDDLCGVWNDDPEKPNEWATFDWAASTVERTYCNFLAHLCDLDEWWATGESTPWHVSVRYVGLRSAPKFVQEVMSYTDEELSDLIDAYPGTNGTKFEAELRAGRRLAHTQRQVYDLWRERRNPTGKRGPAKRRNGIS